MLVEDVSVAINDAQEKQTGEQIYSKYMNTSVGLPEAQQDTALNLHYFLSSCEIRCRLMTGTSPRKSLESFTKNLYLVKLIHEVTAVN